MPIRHLGSQPPAVRVARHQRVRAGFRRRRQRFHRVVRIVQIAVEEMLGVVDHFLAVLLQVAHGIGDHRQVFLRRRLEHLLDVQQPALAEDRRHRRARLQDRRQARVLRRRHARAPRAAERRQLGVLQRHRAHRLEELHVLRVRRREAAFEIVDPEFVQAPGDADLGRHREIDAFALRAVAQGRIVDDDLVHAVLPGPAAPLRLGTYFFFAAAFLAAFFFGAGLPMPNASCSDRTAWSASFARMATEILISEVEIISMLILFAASTSNIL